MPDWSLRGGGGRQEEAGADTSDSSAVTITTGAANTKSSYVQLIASTAFDSYWMNLSWYGDPNNAHFLFDIAVGAAASEQDIVENIIHSGRGAHMSGQISFPLYVASGSRLSARAQSIDGSEDIDIQARIFGKPFDSAAPLGRMTTYGAVTADSGGTQVDPGASGNTKGSYSQIDAAIANSIKMMFIGIGNQGNDARGSIDSLLDIAVGAGGSEQDILDNMIIPQSAVTDVYLSILGPFPVNIPAGSRLAARAQSNSTDASDRLFDVVIYGLD